MVISEAGSDLGTEHDLLTIHPLVDLHKLYDTKEVLKLLIGAEILRNDEIVSLLKEWYNLVWVKIICPPYVDNVVAFTRGNRTINLSEADEQFHLIKSRHTF